MRREAPPRQRLGQRSERLAARLLRTNGYILEATNVRFPVGEIDIVAKDREALCFIEVRSTSSDRWGGPLASVVERKQRRIIHAARWYLKRRRTAPAEVRFDVVAIEWRTSRAPLVQLVRGAFDASDYSATSLD